MLQCCIYPDWVCKLSHNVWAFYSLETFDGEVLLASARKGEQRFGGLKCCVSILDLIEHCVQRWLDWKPRAPSMVSRDRETSPWNSDHRWDDLCRTLFFSSDQQQSLNSELECINCKSEVKWDYWDPSDSFKEFHILSVFSVALVMLTKIVSSAIGKLGLLSLYPSSAVVFSCVLQPKVICCSLL